MARRIKQNQWGNWYGYEGTKRVKAFGNSTEYTTEQLANMWLRGEEPDSGISIDNVKAALRKLSEDKSVAKTLADRLQSIVIGSKADLTDTPHEFDRILNRGELFIAVEKKLDLGDHKCHVNTAELWNAVPKDQYRLCTGYYLDMNSDQCWRSHSWLLDRRTRKVIETTDNNATHYFGYIMSDAEANEFSTAND
jgi:hypothetical protein